jgi:hypothetical protein
VWRHSEGVASTPAASAAGFHLRRRQLCRSSGWPVSRDHELFALGAILAPLGSEWRGEVDLAIPRLTLMHHADDQPETSNC